MQKTVVILFLQLLILLERVNIYKINFSASIVTFSQTELKRQPAAFITADICSVCPLSLTNQPHADVFRDAEVPPVEKELFSPLKEGLKGRV